MSMTISAANNLNSMPQNTRTAEKHGQKDGAAEAGKTQQNAVSASLDQINMGEDGIAVTQVSRQQDVKHSAAQKQPAVSRMDRVEISAEGRAASVRLQKQQSDTDAKETYEYEVEDLSEYTDTELRQMYYKGEITRQEYEDETGESLK